MASSDSQLSDLEVILGSTGEGICGVDAAGRCCYANPAGALALGVAAPEALQGRSLSTMLVHGDGGADALVATVVAEGVPRRLHDATMRRRDGGEFPAVVEIHPVSRPGSALAAVVTFRDISERRKRDARLLQAQKMEAVGQLTGGICHDFNNLLTVIVGNLRALVDTGALAPDDAELAEDALSAACDGVNLTRRLLSVARERKLKPRAVDLKLTLSDFARLLKRMLGSGVQVELALGDAFVAAFLDRTQFESAVLNLAINARNAMPEGRGTVRIATDRVELDEHDGELAPGPYARIRVIDDGAGMDDETRRRATEPFFTTRAGGGGTGLGLSMVYGFVQQSGGALRIDSEVGHGTTVTILLPFVDQASPQTVMFGMPTKRRDGGGERVLVVEDEERVRRYAVRALERLGYQVSQAEDALAAVQMLRSDEVDLVVSDVRMPGMSGYDLAAWIRSRKPGLAVLLTTGYSPDEDGDGAPVDAPDDVPLLRKPYTEQQLARDVRRLLDEVLAA